jgi:hypothetical protein
VRLLAAVVAAARRAGTGRRPHAPCGACGCRGTVLQRRRRRRLEEEKKV